VSNRWTAARRAAAYLLVSLALLPLSGCALMFQRSLKDGLRQDVQALLRPFAGEIAMECEAVEETRAGYCLGTLDQISLARTGAGLRLQEAFSDAARNAAMQEAGSCLNRPEFQNTILKIAEARNRPPQLELPNGSAFEYLYLIWDQPTGKFCVAASYSYG
jgi:hypothetical protein